MDDRSHAHTDLFAITQGRHLHLFHAMLQALCLCNSHHWLCAAATSLPIGGLCQQLDLGGLRFDVSERLRDV